MRSIFLTLAIIAAGCSKGNSPLNESAPPPIPVRTASVETRSVPLFFEAMGVIKPCQTAEVKPQVHGMIQLVHFAEGQKVEKGALLYTIDDTPYAIKVQEMQALLIQDQEHLKNAQKKLQRFKSLSNPDLIAQVEWDEVETQIALYEAMVIADKMRLSSALLDKEHCQIFAPISGRIGKSCLDAGNMAENSTLVNITLTEPLFVDFAITEKELKHLSQSALSIEIFAPGEEECLGRGVITFLDHSLDPRSGMLPAQALLKTTSQQLWMGQSVRVHVIYGSRDSAQLIPLKAIKTSQSGPYVFSVKDDNSVEMVHVKLGAEEKGWIVVEEGLGNCHKIVTEGQGRLFPGSKIEEVL